jgi:hypothetical protein
MFVFNNTEERWFLNWVVLRRKFLISEAQNVDHVKTIEALKEVAGDLRAEILDIKRNPNSLLKIEVLEAKNRKKMIEDFNKANNKPKRYKKRKKRKR